MNESYSPPIKNHGNTPFIIVTVVMLGIAGVLLWLKAQKRSETSAASQASASATPTTVERIQRATPLSPPPPPPPPDAVEPAPAAASARLATSQPLRQSVCSTPCQGNTNPTLESQLATRSQQSRSCYQRALRTSESLRGKLVVELQVGADGSVCQASIAADTLGDASVGSCVLQRFQSGRLPKPSGGCVNVRVPINFMPDR